MPEASIYVFDNCSTDDTARVAGEAGAHVVRSPRPGKGNVIRHMRAVIDADIYVIADGDDTYPASAAPELIARYLDAGVDMLVATRLHDYEHGSFRLFHKAGNRIVARLISTLFSVKITDVLSGYRVLSRHFVRTVPLRSSGFEIETEMTLQAVAKNFLIQEHPIRYGARPAGSQSKLNTWADGFLILKSVVLIFKDYRPLPFFAALAGFLTVGSLIAGSAPIYEYYQTGLVYRVPRAILAAGLGTLATISLGVGLILDTVAKYHAENMELWKQHLMDNSEDGG